MRFEIEKDLLAQAVASSFYRGNTFLHDKFAEYLVTGPFHVSMINGVLHTYDGAIYRVGEKPLFSAMKEIIPALRLTQMKEVRAHLQYSSVTPELKLDPYHCIPLADGIYNLHTEKMEAYTPERVFLNRFPVSYNPNAPDEMRVLDFINTVFSGDEKCVRLFFQILAAGLHREQKGRLVPIFYGLGANGKSTLLNLISQFLGQDNISHVSVQDMDATKPAARFRLASIYGKIANISDDLPSQYLADTSAFKRLATGESVTLEYKGQDPFDYESHAILIFACNQVPRAADTTDAWYSRLTVIPLLHNFQKEGSDPDLKNRIWTQAELDCLCKYAIHALLNLEANGWQFEKPDRSMTAMQEYKAANDPIVGFVEEVGAENIIGRHTLSVYREFSDYCKNAGYRNPLEQTTFVRKMRDYLSRVIDSPVTTKKKWTNVCGENKNVHCFVYDSPFADLPDAEPLPLK